MDFREPPRFNGMETCTNHHCFFPLLYKPSFFLLRRTNPSYLPIRNQKTRISSQAKRDLCNSYRRDMFGRRTADESVMTVHLDAGIPGRSTPVVYSPRYGVTSYRSLGSSPSPRSAGARLFGDDEAHHFLDACFLCNKPLVGNRDIFMYRGDTPFCSEECRKEQIDIDDIKERKSNYLCSSRKEQQQQQMQKYKPNAQPQQDIEVRDAGTVVDG